MGILQFELTNVQRKYLGLAPVEQHWELVYMNNMYLYFDGDIIRKRIAVEDSSYLEQELNEKTAQKIKCHSYEIIRSVWHIFQIYA